MMIKSQSEKQTQKIAGSLVQKIIKTKLGKNAIVIALEGELGAGKTTFVKGFAKALGIKSHITSPTFVILKKFQIPRFAKASARRANSRFQILFHIDAYRLHNHRDLITLGIKEIIADPANIVLIEWAERVKKILPKKYIGVHIDHINEHTRKINIQ